VLRVDTTAPVLKDGNIYVGDIPTDINFTNRTSFDVEGQTEPRATAIIYENGVLVGTGRTDSLGRIKTRVDLSEGTHNLSAVLIDQAGNASAPSKPIAFTVDTTKPTVAITADSAAFHGSEPVHVTLTFSEPIKAISTTAFTATGATISNFTATANPSVYTATLIANSPAPANITISVNDAYVDRAGNNGSAASLTLPYDSGTSGTAIDGYVANALVFRDADNDGQWDHETFVDANNNGRFDAGEAFTDSDGNGSFTAEFSAVTDSQGNFSGLFGAGRIVLNPLIAGNGTNLSTDISTGAAFTGQYTAPAGSAVVTPLTTLVDAIAGPGASAAAIAAAMAQVKASLGLGSAVDLKTYDPLAVAGTSTDPAALADALAVQKAAVQVANIITVMSAVTSASGGSAQNGADAAFASLAQQVSGGAVDLSSTAVIGAVVQAVAADAGNNAAILAQASALGTALGSVNGVVQDAQGATIADALGAVVTAQIVAQQNLAQDASTAVSTGTVVDQNQYQGSALNTQMDNAADNVQSIIPQDTAAGAPGAPARPTVDDGARVSASEAGDGVVVSVAYGAASGVAVGDALRLTIGGVVVASKVIQAGDIPGTGASATAAFPITLAQLGADGPKSIAALFVTAGGVEGAASFPLVVTLDTAAPTAPTALALDVGDDTGVSQSDGVTSKTSGLTINGKTEPNAVVILREGTTILATGSSDAQGNFAIDVALGAGAHAVTAQAVDAAGNEGALSAALALTVDGTAPAAPSAFVMSEGALVTVAEAADGTVLAGVTPAGTSVTITLTGTAGTLTKAAAVNGTAFALSLTQGDIAQLGGGIVKFTATAADAAGNQSGASATGQYYYQADPQVDTVNAIDSAAYPLVGNPDDDAGPVVGLTPLAGGGFAAHWAYDANGDGDTDGIAVQRFGADGSKVGGIVPLAIDQSLIDAGDGPLAYSLTALDNGRYALTYAMGLPETGRFATLTGPSGNAPLIGIPNAIYISGLTAGVTVSLRGLGPNGSLVVPLTPDANGFVQIDRAMLAPFVNENRLSLIANGLAAGKSITASIELFQDVRYDLAALPPTQTTTQTSEGATVIVGQAGRVDSFHIDASSAAPTSVQMLINVAGGAASLNLAGIPNATVTPFGTVLLNAMTPDAGGNYRVPQAILEQVGSGDLQTSLLINGLPSGATATVSYALRTPIDLPEGVYLQTFAADGSLTSSVTTRIDGTNAPVVNDDDTGAVGITKVAGGGFVVHWVADKDGDGDGDALALQRFDAAGARVGENVVLSGLSPTLLDAVSADEDMLFDLRPVEGGGYQLAYGLQLQSFGREQNFTSNGGAFTIPVAGRIEELYVGGGATNPLVRLQGLDLNGTVISVLLTKNSDGGYFITDDLRARFQADNRVNVVISGVASGVSVNTYMLLAADVHFDAGTALHGVAASVTTAQNGVAAVGTPLGRVESFHIDQASGTPASVILQITPGPGAGLMLSGYPGATQVASGAWQISGISPDANGNYKVPQAVLDQLGGADAAIVLIATGLTAGSAFSATMQVRDPIDNIEGLFLQRFGADGAALTSEGVRVDSPDAPLGNFDEGEGFLRITPLTGGGSVVQWGADVDGDGDSDSVAAQRFDALGHKVGDVIKLTNIDGKIAEYEGDALPIEVEALASGGYAMTYGFELPEAARYVTMQNPAGLAFISTPFTGVVRDIYGDINLTYRLAGLDKNGAQFVVTLTRTADGIHVDNAVLAQFKYPDRLSLQVGGIPAGGATSFFIDGEALQHADYGEPVHLLQFTGTVIGTSLTLAQPDGRNEAFRINLPSSSVTMTVVLPNGSTNINLTGIAGASFTPDGSIRITNLAPSAGGYYRMPAALFNQIGDSDANVFVTFSGLTAGTSYSAEIEVRDTEPYPHGVFVSTFGPDGLGIYADGALNLAGTAGADELRGDAGEDTLQGFAGNDYLVGEANADFIDGGTGADVLTGGPGADIFVIDPPAGQTLSLADVITDFQPGIDHLDLPGSLTFAGLTIAQGNPGTNGGDATETLLIASASGDILARLANTDAAAITQASFI
jgi:hypothetical protein